MNLTLIAKPHGSRGTFDPLNQIETLGVKIQIDDKQYGAYIMTPELEKLGISVEQEISINMELHELVDGNPTTPWRPE